jgi:hypothetical protein
MRFCFGSGQWAAVAAVGAIGIGASANTAAAADFSIDGNTYNVEAVIGSGSDHALLDINTDPAHSFLFGYASPDGSTPIDGFSLLTDAVAATGGTIVATDSSFSTVGGALQIAGGIYTFETSPGVFDTEHFVETLTYTTGGVTYGNPAYLYGDGPDGDEYAYPDIFTSADAVNFVAADAGADDLTFDNGAVEAFVEQTDGGDPVTYEPDTNPAALLAEPVPEPATLMVVGLVGAVGLTRRRAR